MIFRVLLPFDMNHVLNPPDCGIPNGNVDPYGCSHREKATSPSDGFFGNSMFILY